MGKDHLPEPNHELAHRKVQSRLNRTSSSVNQMAALLGSAVRFAMVRTSRNLTHVISPDDPHTVSANITSSRRLSRTTTSPFCGREPAIDRTPLLWIDFEST